MPERLPRKLKVDAIVEAVFEIRFEPDPSLMSEILFARLADKAEWRFFKQARLPIADIPAPIRRADPELRYQPTFNLTSDDGKTSVQIGPQVVAYSARGAYPGWDRYRPVLEGVVSNLYEAANNAEISRLGLRYVNALKSTDHGIGNMTDLDIALSVGGNPLVESANINFKSGVGTHFETMSRVATVDMAQGIIPEHSTVIVDIDVYTCAGYAERNEQAIRDWISKAHEIEKKTFFMILGENATARLRED